MTPARSRSGEHASLRTIKLAGQDLSAFRLRVFDGFDYAQESDELSEPAHRHDFQELLWIDAGEGCQLVDGIDCPISPNTLHLIARGQVHQFVEARRIDGLMICFTDDFLPGERAAAVSALFDPLRGPRTLPLDGEQAPRFRRLVAQIRDEYQRPADPHKARILGNLLDALMAMLEQLAQHAAPPSGSMDARPERLYAQFAALLEQHYCAVHNVATYAQWLHVPPHALAHATKCVYGKTPKQFIEERLFLEAKRYLRFTSLPVKAISYALGFEDASYFSKFFKRLAGVPPQQFRA